MKKDLRPYAPLVLRLGLAAVFLWFGYQQVMHVAQWESWVPAWALASGVPAGTIVLANGWFEVIFGLLLVSGFYTWVVAGLLALHLFVITFDIGITAIGVRDFGLAVSTLALALMHWPKKEAVV